MHDRLIFDLDGTIIDSKAGIWESVNYALRSLGLSELGQERADYVWMIGPPLRESFRKLAGERATGSLVERLVAKYRERYERVGMFEASVFPGMREVLARLAEGGGQRRLAVATTKPTVQANAVIRHFGLERFFELVAGSRLDGGMSEKRDLIRRVMDVFGGRRAGYLMVGDREYDVRGAKAAGIDSVGVLYGYGTEPEIARAGPTYMTDTPKALGELLLRL